MEVLRRAQATVTARSNARPAREGQQESKAGAEGARKKEKACATSRNMERRKGKRRREKTSEREQKAGDEVHGAMLAPRSINNEAISKCPFDIEQHLQLIHTRSIDLDYFCLRN